jgi:hypothetical protein
MKNFLIFLLFLFLVGCINIPYKYDTPARKGTSFKYTVFQQKLKDTVWYQKQKAQALEKKYQEREQKYNIRDIYKNLYYLEDNVPVLHMGRLENHNNVRSILDTDYHPTKKEWMG